MCSHFYVIVPNIAVNFEISNRFHYSRNVNFEDQKGLAKIVVPGTQTAFRAGHFV